MVILICPGWTEATWWPQLVELRTELAPIRLPAAADYLKFHKGSKEELPNLDPLYAFLRMRLLESGGNNPEVLNEQDLGFLVNHIRKETKGTYKFGWCQFAKFCESCGIDLQWAPVPLIIKFICHLFE